MAVAAVCVLALLPVAALGAGTQANEYLVKSAFLEKICRFVEWPAAAMGPHFEIGVLGDDPFKDALDELARRLPIKGRAVHVHRVRRVEDVGPWQLLFLSRSEEPRLRELLAALAQRPILLVGDTPGYAARGVHVNFYLTPTESIHFELNPASLQRAGLRVDASLIEYAKVVQ